MEGVDVTLAALDHYHGAIVQVGHPLAQFLALLDYVDAHFLARQHDGLEGVGQFVDVKHLHPLKFRHPIEVIVGCQDRALHGAGHLHQHGVNLVTVGNAHVQDVQGNTVVPA